MVRCSQFAMPVENADVPGGQAAMGLLAGDLAEHYTVQDAGSAMLVTPLDPATLGWQCSA